MVARFCCGLASGTGERLSLSAFFRFEVGVPNLSHKSDMTIEYRFESGDLS